MPRAISRARELRISMRAPVVQLIAASTVESMPVALHSVDEPIDHINRGEPGTNLRKARSSPPSQHRAWGRCLLGDSMLAH